MSAADWMVVRTRSGAYKSVPRRKGLAMIAAGRASIAGRGKQGYQTPALNPTPPVERSPKPPAQSVDQARKRIADAMGLPVEAITPTPDSNPHDAAANNGARLMAELDERQAPAPRELPPEPKRAARRGVWADYADSLGVEVTSAMTKRQIQDAAEEAAKSLANLPQPALTGGRLETPEDEPVTVRSVTDDEDPGIK